jgi:DNA repair exonuclease SbcCD ATPase subunit
VESLEKGEKLVIKREYKEALIEYEKVLRIFPKVSPGDNALFHMGLIWLHPDNPQRDYEKSLISFQRVIHDFSQTRLREKARVLSYVVAELIRSENDIKKLKESADSLQNRLRKENGERANTLKKQIEELEKLKGQLKELKGQLEELKEIDIVIEEKKRDRE